MAVWHVLGEVRSRAACCEVWCRCRLGRCLNSCFEHIGKYCDGCNECVLMTESQVKGLWHSCGILCLLAGSSMKRRLQYLDMSL